MQIEALDVGVLTTDTRQVNGDVSLVGGRIAQCPVQALYWFELDLIHGVIFCGGRLLGLQAQIQDLS